MKQVSKLMALVFAVSLFAVSGSKAQIFVPKRPAGSQKPSKRPNRYEVWVPDEWFPLNNKYVYQAGHWAFPPTEKSVYVPGHWQKTPKGYYWIAGYWKNPHV